MSGNEGQNQDLPTYQAVNALVNRFFSTKVDGQCKVPQKIVDKLKRKSDVVGKKLKWRVGHDWFSPENDSHRLGTMAALHDLLEEIRPGLGSLVIPITWESRRGINAYAIRVYEDEVLHQREVKRVAGLASPPQS
jgi:hypothetical protein